MKTIFLIIPFINLISIMFTGGAAGIGGISIGNPGFDGSDGNVTYNYNN